MQAMLSAQRSGVVQARPLAGLPARHAAVARPRFARSSRLAVVARAAPPPLIREDARPRGRGLLHGFWTFVDVVAILGSVGGAMAALLGLASASMVLPLPIVLPMVSLVAAMQRESLARKVGTPHLAPLSPRGAAGRPRFI